MKNTFLKFFIPIFFLTLKVSAYGIYNLDYYWPLELDSYFEKINTHSKVAHSEANCSSFYNAYTQDGVLDVRYALGYFDDSQGKEIIHDDKNHGLSPSLDIAVYGIIKEFLKKACKPNQKNLMCGFQELQSEKEGKSVLQKEISLQGKNIFFKITLTHASASDSFVLNTSELKERQRILTEQSEENFFDGLQTADVVIYNGHSRNGGGPDFNPPVLNSRLKTDFKGYYEKNRAGIKRVLSQLRVTPVKNQLVGFFSCYSKRHFLKDLFSINPSQRLILSSDTIDYLDSLLASLGYMDGLAQGYCGEQLSNHAKQGSKIQGGFQSFNLK